MQKRSRIIVFSDATGGGALAYVLLLPGGTKFYASTKGHEEQAKTEEEAGEPRCIKVVRVRCASLLGRLLRSSCWPRCARFATPSP